MRLFFVIFLLSLPIFVFCVNECVLRKTYTISKMINLCKNKDHLNFAEHATFKLENLSQDDFDALLGNLKSVHAALEIVSSSAKELNFRQMEKYYSSDLTTSFHHNEYLEKINFSKLIYIDLLGGQMKLTDNPKLQELHFPVMEKILFFGDQGGNLTIQNNSLLKSVKVPTAKLFEMSELRIIQNPSLETIEIYNIPKEEFEWRVLANKFEITGKLVIVENDSLKTFHVANRDDKKNMTIERMEILRNRKLERIPIELKNKEIEIWIEGNPKMEREVLEELRRLAKNDTGRIQDYGECSFNGPVMDLTILDDCGYVYGNLTLTPATQGKVSVRLPRVEGDVYISDLAIDRLDFLLDTEIFGKFESALCDFDFSPFKAANKRVRKSCRTEEATTRKTTTTAGSTGRSTATTTVGKMTEETTRKTTTATETTERSMTTTTAATTEEMTTSTKGKEETTEKTEEMETSTVGEMTEEMTKEEPSTENRTELTTTAEGMTELPLTEDKKEENKPISSSLTIICVAVVLVLLLIGVGIFLWKRKSKMRKEKLRKEESSMKSGSSRESTSSQRREPDNKATTR